MLTHYHYDTFDLVLPVLGAVVPAEFIVEDGKILGLSVMMEPTPGVNPEVFKR